jgi:hypothetical protein
MRDRSQQVHLGTAIRPPVQLVRRAQDSRARVPISGHNSRRYVARDRKNPGCQSERFFVAPSATEIARFNPFTHCARLKSSLPRTNKCT